MSELLSDYLELMSGIPSGSVDLVLTDPPYGIGYRNNYTHVQHDVLTGDESAFSYAKFAAEAFRVLKPNTAVFAFTGWSTYPTHYPELEAAGFHMREPVICQKRASGPADLYGTFQTNADWVMFGHKGRFRFQPTELVKNKRAGTVPNPGRKPVPDFKTRFPSCWFGEDYPWASENSNFQALHDLKHPTIKGEQFIEWLIRLACPEGGIVLDPFVGSGTTAVAARNCGRRFIVGDIDPRYAEMTARRLRTLTPAPPVADERTEP